MTRAMRPGPALPRVDGPDSVPGRNGGLPAARRSALRPYDTRAPRTRASAPMSIPSRTPLKMLPTTPQITVAITTRRMARFFQSWGVPPEIAAAPRSARFFQPVLPAAAVPQSSASQVSRPQPANEITRCAELRQHGPRASNRRQSKQTWGVKRCRERGPTAWRGLEPPSFAPRTGPIPNGVTGLLRTQRGWAPAGCRSRRALRRAPSASNGPLREG
jgi:hypothetical protein